MRVDNLTKAEVLEKIGLFLGEPKFHQIATVNPEFILHAQQDTNFKKILNATDLNVADGFGLNLAFWKKGERLKARIAGADLLLDILKIAQAQKLSVFLAINKDGLYSLEEVKSALEGQFEGLEVVGQELLKSERNLDIDKGEILLCNFGAPDQEKFLKSVKSDTIRLAIGVGGSFDFLTGKLKRAPRWMRQIGLEWLFRLIQQPRRFKRIWNAVVIFPIKILFSK